MKIKTSMTEMTRRFKCYRVGYCDLQNLFRTTDADYYNAGVYGWNCDIYVDYKRGVALTTGYRNMRGERLPGEVIRKYEELAKDIHKEAGWTAQSYETYKAKMGVLVDHFFGELANM